MKEEKNEALVKSAEVVVQNYLVGGKKMKVRTLLFTLLVIAMLFISCTPVEAPQARPEPEEGAKKPEVSTLLPWEQEWQRLVLEAKKEDIMNLYVTWSADERRAMMEAFKKDFGITISPALGKGEEIAEKVITEHRYGLYLADVYIGGPTTQFNVLKPAGVTVPIGPVLIHPDVTDPERIKQAWYGGEIGWLDKERYLITFTGYPTPNIAVNTSMMKPEELASYKDLLNPKWKGKITWNDPTIAGAGAKTFTFFLEEIGGRDFIEQLIKQEVMIIRDQRLQVDWLVRGKYPIAISPKTSTLEEAIHIGAPVTWVTPKEGTYLSVGGGTMSLIKKAPHPNAAKLFVNWILTKEVQTIFSKVSGRQSRRADVPYDHIQFPREPGKKYVVLDTAERLPKQVGHVELASEMFKPLLR